MYYYLVTFLKYNASINKKSHQFILFNENSFKNIAVFVLNLLSTHPGEA